MQAPFGTILEAMMLGPSQNSGTIYLKPGIYSGKGNTGLYSQENVFNLAKWPDLPGEVLIDCQGISYAFVLQDVLFGFAELTFQNCVSSGSLGGGAIWANHSQVTLTNVSFFGNRWKCRWDGCQ